MPYLFLVHINSSEQNYFALLCFICRRIIHYKVALYCGDGGTPTSFGTGGCCYLTDSHTGLQCRGRLSRPHRLTTPRTTRPSVLAAGSRVRAGLQRGGQLTCPYRFTAPRPTHLSARAADSLVIDFSFTMVIINSAVDNF